MHTISLTSGWNLTKPADTSLGRGKGVIDFGHLDLIFKVTTKTLKVSLVRTLSHESIDTSLGLGKEVIRFW